MVLFSLVLAIASLTGAVAQVCTGNETLHGYSRYEISSQDQLDALAEECTVLEHVRVQIMDNYTGAFNMHGITNLTGTIEMDRHEPEHNPSSFEFPDLVHATDFFFYELPSATRFSAPKLEYVEGLTIVTTTPETVEFEFPALKNATRIMVQGNLTSVSFPVLESVHGRLQICNVQHCGTRDSRTNITMDVSLPMLRQAAEVDVEGNLSSLAVPELASADHSLNVRNGGGSGRLTVFGFSGTAARFPELAVTSSVWLQGNITSLSLPALRALNSTFWFDNQANEPIAIKLSLENVSEINFQGAIDSVALPNLYNFRRMTVRSSESGFDCERFVDAVLDNAHASIQAKEGSNVYCTSGAGAMRGLGLVTVGIAAMVSLAGFL